jgi:hypothetical protein
MKCESRRRNKYTRKTKMKFGEGYSVDKNRRELGGGK